MESWTSPGVIAATISAIAAVVGSAISWLVYKQTRPADELVVRLTIDPCPDRPGYLLLHLWIENFSASTWRELTLLFKRPRALRWAEQGLLLDRIHGSGLSIRPTDAEFAAAFDAVSGKGPFRPPNTISPSGSISTLGGARPRDQTWVHLYLDAASFEGDSKLSMRVSLRSTDAKPRKHTVAIKRTIPVNTTIATD